MTGRVGKSDLASLSILVFLLVVFFGKLLFTNGVFYSRDLSQYYRPVSFLATECVQRGIFPFWNPYISCGQPFLATVQHGLLYPLSLLKYLLPFDQGFTYGIIGHLFLAGLGFFLMLRAWKFSAWTSLGASIIFVFSGTMISLINLVTSLQALAWVGFLGMFAQKAAARTDYLFWSVLLSFTAAGQFLAGQPEIMYLSVLFWLLASFFLSGFSRAKNIIISVLCGTALVLLLTAVMLVPFLELLRNSARQTPSLAAGNLFWSLPLRQLPDVIFPGLAGKGGVLPPGAAQEWLRSIYLGIIPSSLVLLGFLTRGANRRVYWCFVSLTLLALLLALGEYTPIYKLAIMVVPGLKMMRYPVKFFLFCNFGLAVLSAFGLSLLEKLRWRRAAMILTLVLVFAGTALVTYNLENTIPLSFTRQKGDFSRALSALGWQRYSFTPKTYMAITAMSLGTKASGVSIDNISRWEMLPDQAIMNHNFIARGYESINLGIYQSFYDLLSLQTRPSDSHILDLMGVKYLASLWPMSDPNWELVKDEGWKLYQNKKVLPRVFLADQPYYIKDFAALLTRLKDKIEPSGLAEVTSYDLNRITVKTFAAAQKYLILTDTFYPGWEAYIDGQKAEIYPAFAVFRGLIMPAGEHSIEFIYQPQYFFWGLLGTLGALALCWHIIFRTGAKL